MSEDNGKPTCIACDHTEDDYPLIAIRFKGEGQWICAQHLPILIHKPHLLADKLPGAVNLTPAEHEH